MTVQRRTYLKRLVITFDQTDQMDRLVIPNGRLWMSRYAQEVLVDTVNLLWQKDEIVRHEGLL
jgi:hypothetical protein